VDRGAHTPHLHQLQLAYQVSREPSVIQIFNAVPNLIFINIFFFFSFCFLKLLLALTGFEKLHLV
jgi:hypothetical protein